MGACCVGLEVVLEDEDLRPSGQVVSLLLSVEQAGVGGVRCWSNLLGRSHACQALVVDVLHACLIPLSHEVHAVWSSVGSQRPMD